MDALMVLNPYTSSNNALNGWSIEYNCLRGKTALNSSYAGTNPPFTPSDLVSFFPEFKGLVETEDTEYFAVTNLFIKMSNCRLDANILGCDWMFCMSSLTAHYLCLMFMRMSGQGNVDIADIKTRIQQIGSSSTGVAVKEDLGGEAIEVSLLENDKGLSGGGEYLTTPYGRLFWTTYKPYGRIYSIGVYRGRW